MYLRIIHVYIIYNMSTYMYVSGTHVCMYTYIYSLHVAIIMTHDTQSAVSTCCTIFIHVV
jgi:hypothetical protein